MSRKERMPLEDMSNQTGCERDKDTKADTPLQVMHAVHLRLSRALKEVDGMMSTAHYLYCANQLSVPEAKNFTSAMTEMTECVEAWQDFFKNAAGEAFPIQHEDALIDLYANSLSCSGEGDSPEVDNTFISSSPLIPCKSRTVALFSLTPLDRPSKVCKQGALASSFGDVKSPVRIQPSSAPKLDPGPVVVSYNQPESQPLKSPDLDPVTIVEAGPPPPMTPIMSSTPQAMQIRTSSPHNREFAASMTRQRQRLRDLDSPDSMELLTPHPPQFLSKYPELWGKHGMGTNAIPSTPVLETPNFWKSPPKTCRPIKLLENGSFDVVTPNCTRSGIATPRGAQSGISTPYGTPDSVLRPLTPFSVSRSSHPIIVDDMSASTVKRIGVQGLEDDLWRKLQAWHIDTNLAGPYAKLRSCSSIPFPKHTGCLEKGNI